MLARLMTNLLGQISVILADRGPRLSQVRSLLIGLVRFARVSSSEVIVVRYCSKLQF